MLQLDITDGYAESEHAYDVIDLLLSLFPGGSFCT